MRKIRIISALVLALSMLLICSCSFVDLSDPSHGGGVETQVITGDELLRITYIDVGQGDSAFIELPNGKCMLIDAAEKDEVRNVINCIKRRGYSKIDYLVMTHPHSDHMGGMTEVMQRYEIGVLYMTNAVNTGSAFEEVLDVVERKEIPVKRSQKGVVIEEDGELKAEFLSPVSEEYEELNDYSSVVKITYKERSFLFMGDAEKLAEDELGSEVRCDVVKVGHHGSKTSSSEDFVKKTRAAFAVISVGEANSYGHPASAIVSRWEKYGAKILRTDVEGSVIFTSDGQRLYLECEKGTQGEITLPETEDFPNTDTTPSVEYLWILNVSSKKIHRPDCSGVASMNEENKEYTLKSLEELMNEGYKACGTCKPEEDKK